MKMSDYEIQEIRRIRHRISAEHGHDLRRLAEYYHRIELELRNSGKYRFFDGNQVSPVRENRETSDQTCSQ
jgi:hypothetical protein